MIEIEFEKKAVKWLERFKKTNKNDFELLDYYFSEKLKKCNDNPKTLGRAVQNRNDELWRWRCGNYRILGYVNQNGVIYIVKVIKIVRKSDTTYKQLD